MAKIKAKVKTTLEPGEPGLSQPSSSVTTKYLLVDRMTTPPSLMGMPKDEYDAMMKKRASRLPRHIMKKR